MARTILALLLIALAGCARVQPAAPDTSGHAVVTAVVDGDTLEVDVGGRAERVRLVGIDTPVI